MKIGIDIGGSHIAVGLVNDKGEIIKKLEKDIKKHENIEKDIVDYVDKCILELMEAGDIESIGIAAPGNPKKYIINNIVNLGIKQLNFKILEEKYNIPIRSINDAKAAALAEKEYGAIKGYQDSVFLCLGTGIGGAVFLNNKLLKANKNPGFELGHIVIDRYGKQCNCGKKGCFETYCSIKRLKDEIIQELKNIEEDIKINQPSDILEQLKQKAEYEPIKNIINNYIDNIIIGLSNIIDIFEPEIIVLGGSFVYFKDILYTTLIEEMQKRKYVFNKDSLPKIELAKLKNDAGIIGATLI